MVGEADDWSCIRVDLLSLLTITQPIVTKDVDRMNNTAAVMNSATRAGMQKQHRRVYCAGGRESKTSSEGALGGRTMVVGDMDMIEVVKVNYLNGRIGQRFGYRPAGHGWSSKCG
jgi:hypothetical protein